MTDLTLTNLTPRQLASLGDAALRNGDVAMAKTLYQHLVKLDPASTQSQARLGLTLSPTRRTLAMLEALTALEKIPGGQAYVGEGIATWLKLPAFVQDPRFMALASRHVSIAPAGSWHWNLQTVLWAAQQARNLPGDFVELGVFRGHTTLFLADYLEFGGWDRRWWLYDTFEGIPDDQVDPGWELINKESYKGTFSYEEVRDRFAGFPNIVVTQGRVPQVFDQVCPDAIAFMHIDLNSSAAEIAALDALYDKITPGGVIVFDDFGWQTAHAQFKAELAWFTARGLTIFPLPTGQGLFVKPPVQAA
jgi:O-methyltransferase